MSGYPRHTRLPGKVDPVALSDGIPRLFSNLVLWFDGSTIAGSDNDVLSGWVDKSGNGFDATQSNVPNRPTLSVSGDLRGVKFSSAAVQFFTGTLSGVSANSDATFFLVIKLTSTVAQQGFCDFAPSNATNTGFMLIRSTFFSYRTSASNACTVPYDDVTYPNLFTCITEGAIHRVVRGRNYDSADGARVAFSAPLNFKIGQLFQSVWPANATIYEIIMYNRSLRGTSDLAYITEYLYTKYPTLVG